MYDGLSSTLRKRIYIKRGIKPTVTKPIPKHNDIKTNNDRTVTFNEPLKQMKNRAATTVINQRAGINSNMQLYKKTGVTMKTYKELKKNNIGDNTYTGVWNTFLNGNNKSGGCGSCGKASWNN